MKLRLLVAGTLLGLLLVGCQTAPPIDLERLRAEGRVIEGQATPHLTWGSFGRMPPRGGVPFAWKGDRATLRREWTGFFDPGSRLVVDAVDGRGTHAEFCLDTGTSVTHVSTADPLAGGLRVYAEGRYRRQQGGPDCRFALASGFRMGGLAGQDATVVLVPKPHSLGSMANIIGMDMLWTLVLRHRSGSWSLIREDLASTSERGVVIPLVAPGLPLVDLVDAQGRRVYGLIDTGAPVTVAVTEKDEGAYELRSPSGRTLMRLETEKTAGWEGLRVGGHALPVLIGLKDLAKIDFDLHLGSGVWRLYPEE